MRYSSNTTVEKLLQQIKSKSVDTRREINSSFNLHMEIKGAEELGMAKYKGCEIYIRK